MKTKIIMLGVAALISGLVGHGLKTKPTVAGPAVAGPAGIIDVSEIKPGMKGYGLSVFSGEKVERFEVEVVDVVPNFQTRQPIILVICSGQDLDKTMVVAGMSGSPVWIEGRLAGAIAYGWRFSNRPLAGITPIKNMLETMTRPRQEAVSGHPFPATASAGPQASGPEFGLKPIATPLAAGGFSPAGLEFMAGELEGLGLIPVAGGALSSPELNLKAAAELGPGSALGAALIIGDLSLVAIGTLTWREGDRVVAFGHPFVRGGPVSLPLVAARIHTIVSSRELSIKLGSPTAVVGEMIDDQTPGIVGVLNQKPPLIPFTIRVANPGTGYQDQYQLHLAAMPALTPVLARIALREVINAAAPATDPSTVRVRSRLWLTDYGPVEYSDVYAVQRQNFSMGFLDPVLFLAANPFERVRLERAEIELTIADDLQIAFIDSLSLATDEVGPGDTVELQVMLRPYNEQPRQYRFLITVPNDPSLRAIEIRVTGGGGTRPDAARPRSVKDMIEFMDAVFPANHLVVSYRAPGQSVDVEGTRLKSLPPSVSSMLQPPSTTSGAAAADMIHLEQETPFVVLGGQKIKLKVNADKNRKR